MNEQRVVRCKLHTYPDECYLIVTEKGVELPIGEHEGTFLSNHSRGVGPLKGWMRDFLVTGNPAEAPKHLWEDLMLYENQRHSIRQHIAAAISEILGEETEPECNCDAEERPWRFCEYHDNL